jgi:hypothetical protein
LKISLARTISAVEYGRPRRSLLEGIPSIRQSSIVTPAKKSPKRTSQQVASIQRPQSERPGQMRWVTGSSNRRCVAVETPGVGR